jgi:cell wall-associated NlpC family hydrolase
MTASRPTFTLTGKTAPFDRRREAVRGDLADVALAGKLFAPHYAEAVPFICTKPFSALHETPNGPQNSELLAGEAFMVLDISGGWAWGWSAHDHYVGYVDASAVIPGEAKAKIATTNDPVQAAASFIGEPYVWGGRGGAGIDCSGLVQRGYAAIGVSAPRDSDMQLVDFGTLLPEDSHLRRGDLIFFPGHVGIKYDKDTILHATRYHGKTVIEPLSDVVERVKVKNEGIGIVGRKRIIL